MFLFFKILLFSVISFLLQNLIILSSAQAFESVSCWPSASSSQMMLWKADGKLKLLVQNNHGFENMPLVEGPISTNLIPWVKMQSDELKGLADSFKYEWEISKCQFNTENPLAFMCDGPSVLNGENLPADGSTKPLTSYVMSSTEVVEKSLSYEVKSLKIRLSIDGASGNTYFVSLPFAKDYCSIK